MAFIGGSESYLCPTLCRWRAMGLCYGWGWETTHLLGHLDRHGKDIEQSGRAQGDPSKPALHCAKCMLGRQCSFKMQGLDL